MKVTLKDIAARTGVSVNTVSHALAGKTDISAAKRAEIVRVADEMGYIRNSTAGGLRSGHSHTVAVILPDLANPNFTIMLRGIEAVLREAGYTAFVLNTDEDASREAAAIRAALGQNADGVILCPAAGDAANLRYLARAGVPFTLIGRHCGEVKTDFVVCDDELGGWQAASYLLDMGHRDIAFFNGDCLISGALERLAGARRAFSERGLSLPPARVLALSVKARGNRAAIRAFLAANPTITALIAFSDLLAYEVITVLQEDGKSVPEDLSIIGFDNVCADYALPFPLTSISVAKKTMATAAAELLLDKMAGRAAPENHIILPTTPVERSTVKKLL